MTVKSQTGFFPSLLSNRHYSGTISTLLYNWPIFAGALFFGLVALTASMMLSAPWNWLFLVSGIGVLGLIVSILVTTFFVTDARHNLTPLSIVFPVLAVMAILAGGYFMRKEQFGRLFIMTCLTIAFAFFSIFTILYPRVMVSSLNPAWSLTIQNAASSPATLRLMTIVTLIFLPIVLIYQAWTYWTFRKRVSGDVEKLTY